ncbi:hypothetical protein JCM19314_2462 [Nonlabens ulvanivorans]|uniref:Thiamine-binding protein domain-containing protein n=2 Tax=Nonlabens ulvanivorans TaxID=906888 RepID=A0A081D6L9_NONUL|nr:hypothetical protein [Nonlabens ulvanivorans]GAK74565.1 hypothetical protein JCM19296_143 [Nonlabens ulvanivorans]GAK98431.1 hypothetical protein JCM19314_2462 [Nonlabens ulvanivorans]
MKASIELTMSPLQDDYEQHIIDFIKTLRESEFTVLENPLATQIYGDFVPLMQFLTREMSKSMEQTKAVLFYMKVVKTDRSDYEPFFR